MQHFLTIFHAWINIYNHYNDNLSSFTSYLTYIHQYIHSKTHKQDASHAISRPTIQLIPETKTDHQTNEKITQDLKSKEIETNYDFNYWINANLKHTPAYETIDIYEKRQAIRQTFIQAYTAYDSKCHGQDELVPIGGKCHNWVGMGLTIIDSLDTMYIMGLPDMLDTAHSWIAQHLNLNINRRVSFFETVIRCLGGLMSIYDLTKDKIYLQKALELAERMSPAFSTANGLPLSEINLATGMRTAARWTGGSVLLAEVGTIQLEFQSVSDRSGQRKYGDFASKIIETLDPERDGGPQLPMRGQYPIYLSTNSVKFKNAHITWGAMGDSFYEYLLKFWIYTGKKADSRYRRMYIEAVEGMFENLYKKNEPTGLYFIAESKNGRIDDKFDELACFTGGMLALGVMHNSYFTEVQRERHTSMAVNLGLTCYEMFHRQKSGLSPEFVRFGAGGMRNGIDFYILRPETVETMMYLYRLTHDQQWREKGWEIYQNIERSCKVPADKGVGYSPVLSVGHNPRHDPKGVMHSFFLAETLKYLYLLFSNENVMSLEHFVFNTEAHAVLIPKETFAPQ